MKTKFLKAFAAVMMTFSFAGFVRAEGELEITASIANAGENVTLSEKTNNAYTAENVVLSDNTKLTLTCEGADIYYTTDGTTPAKPTEPASKAVGATKYSEAFVVTEGMKGNDGKIVIKAIAYKEAAQEGGEENGGEAKATATESDVLTITLTLKAEEQEPTTPTVVNVPAFEKKEGAEADTIVVKLGEADSIFVATGVDSAAAVASVFTKYTADAKIAVTKDTVVVAYAMKDEAKSDTVKYVYTKTTTPVDPDPETVAVPAFEKKEGAEADTIVVKLGEADSIFVATGVDSAAAVASVFTKYTADAKIAVTKDTVVVAYAMKDEAKSDTVKYVYTKTTTPVDPEPETVAAPAFNKMNDSTVVVVMPADVDSMFVAMGADSAHATPFVKFLNNDTISLVNVEDTVILAYAMKGEEMSAIVKYEYKAEGNEPIETVAVPTFNKMNDTTVVVVMPADVDSMMVAVGATEAAAIEFTMFDKSDTIVLNADAVIRAYAMKDGKYSDTAVYEFKKGPVANDSKELAGVRVYPNPSNGQFNVCVPVNAVVEVFGLNGQMVKRVNVSAGENAMQIDNAGIYFVRVRANGQVSIKKVVVR
ncbi:MAG: T9SS type A sorting domain-containing protein [Bacteroides sp.]|nr:T9SS type A sorting domain-containing protein [Ruminococcus flavefaciens]MCM1555647.1 T9SS type A sorting domain-containing protein [Bacteroides sp.]